MKLLFLKRMLAAWNRSEREKINENWTDIERGFSAANTAINTAQETAEDGVTRAKNAQATADDATKKAVAAQETATTADDKADDAVETANNASIVANGIDGKATEALNKSKQAVSTSNTARDTAQQAKTTAEATAKQISDVIKETGDTNAEVVAARTDTNDGITTPTVGVRLDSMSSKIQNVLNLQGYELSSKGRTKGGIVVFISDDARQEDLTNLKPIFEAANVPLCIGVISSVVGTNRYMTQAEILDVQNRLKWEVLSHSSRHVSNPYIQSRTLEEAMIEYKDSKEALIKMGFNVQSFATPYGQYSERERRLAQKYYRAARISANGGVSGINYSPLETYELKTVWLDEVDGRTDAAYFKTLIDTAVEKNGLLIISTHGFNVTQQATKDAFADVIAYAKEKARVMRLSDALDEMGNVIEIGDYTRTFPLNGTDIRSPKTAHFVVGCNGEFSISELKKNDDNKSLLPINQFNLQTPFADLPIGIYSIPITTSNASGSPTGLGGVINVFKVHDVSSSLYPLNYQEFVPFNTNLTYRRFVKADGTWGDLKLEKQDVFDYVAKDALVIKATQNYTEPINITIERDRYIQITANNANGAYVARGVYQVANVDNGGAYSYLHKVYKDNHNAEQIDFDVSFGATGNIVLTLTGTQPNKQFSYKISKNLLF